MCDDSTCDDFFFFSPIDKSCKRNQCVCEHGEPVIDCPLDGDYICEKDSCEFALFNDENFRCEWCQALSDQGLRESEFFRQFSHSIAV